jgi:hypothetical protein
VIESTTLEPKTLLIREHLLLPAAKTDQRMGSNLHLHLPLDRMSVDDSPPTTTESPLTQQLNIHLHHHRRTHPPSLFPREWPEMPSRFSSSSASSLPSSTIEPTDLDAASAEDNVPWSSHHWPKGNHRNSAQFHVESRRQSVSASDLRNRRDGLHPKARLVHDGLPGFPPPKDFKISSLRLNQTGSSNDAPQLFLNNDISRSDNADVELAADGAGFVVDSNQDPIESSPSSSEQSDEEFENAARIHDSKSFDQMQAESIEADSNNDDRTVNDTPIKVTPIQLSSDVRRSNEPKPQSRSDGDRLNVDLIKSSGVDVATHKPISSLLSGNAKRSEQNRFQFPESMLSFPTSMQQSMPTGSATSGHFPLFVAQQSNSMPVHRTHTPLHSASSLLPTLLRPVHFGMPFRLQKQQRRRRRRRDLSAQLNPFVSTRKYRIFALNAPRFEPLVGKLRPFDSNSQLSSLDSTLSMSPKAAASSDYKSNGLAGSTGSGSIERDANTESRKRSQQPLSRTAVKTPLTGYNYASLTNGYRPPSPMIKTGLGSEGNSGRIRGELPAANGEPNNDDDGGSGGGGGNNGGGGLFNLLNSLNGGIGDAFSGRSRKQADDLKSVKVTPSTAPVTSAPKYGILGSGNFEIIRGGFYKEPPRTNKMTTDDVAEKKKIVDEADANGGSVPTEDGEEQDDGLPQTDKTDSNSVDPNQFLANDLPLLGFQGFDDFARATNRKPQTQISLFP